MPSPSVATILRDPIMPVLHGLDRLLVRNGNLELGQWDGQTASVPPSQHEHLVRAFLLGSRSYHLHLITDAEW